MEIEKSIETIEKAVGELPTLKGELENVKKELETMKAVSIISNKSSDNSDSQAKVKFWNDVFKKSINEYTAAEGGYTIPEEWAANILDVTPNYGVVRPGATVYPMTSDTMNVQDISALSVGYISGSAGPSESNITLTPYVLSLKDIGVMLRYDNNFLADVTPAKVATIENQAMKAFAKYEDYVSLAGSGATNAANAGITGVTALSTVSAHTMTSTAFSGITAADLAGMIDLATGDIQNGEFFFDRSIRQYIRVLKGTNEYIWSAGSATDVERIWGYKVNWLPTGVLPASSASATGKVFGCFGDKRGILIGNRGEIQVATSADAGFTTNQTLVRFIKRIDVKIIPTLFANIKTAAS